MRDHIFGKTIRLLILLFVMSQVISCGQKGDLYHSGEEQSSISPITLLSYSLA